MKMSNHTITDNGKPLSEAALRKKEQGYNQKLNQDPDYFKWLDKLNKESRDGRK